MDKITENKKKRFNSKNKGNGFENQVAKKLSTSLAPLKFIRTPGSGARVGGKNFQAYGELFGQDALNIFVGDVVPVNQKEAKVLFNFSIECKSYAKSDSFEVMVAGNANVFKWMQESIIDASKINKIPLLIFKWNRSSIFVAGLSKDMSIPPKMTISQNGVSIDIFLLDDLLPNKDFWYNSLQ
jgi:hypothetical protein